MTIIDINTRYAYAYPIKNKTSNHIAELMEKFI
jgi:hypothetical protein